MKSLLKGLAVMGSLLVMFGVTMVNQNPPGFVFVKNAEAIIGLPCTPLSYAGVARRTTRRFVGTEAAVATMATAAAYAPQPTVVVVDESSPSATSASAVPVGTIVQALPAGCSSIVVNGVSYSDCGGTFYKAAFQGNNLVYVVVEKPIN